MGFPTIWNVQRNKAGVSPFTPAIVLSLQPLLATIRNSIDIGGLEIEDEVDKVAAYADDILFYISNPRITLLNLMKLESYETWKWTPQSQRFWI